MPGPVPKPAHLRQRGNRTSTKATLPTEQSSAKNVVPPLPKREKATEKWHPRVLEWWSSIWRSPMAQEYLGPDKLGGLFALAELHQRRWDNPDTKTLIALSAEMRALGRDFGLSPMDRRRLQWEVDKGEQAEERNERRRRSKDLDKATKGKDPRDLLKAVG